MGLTGDQTKDILLARYKPEGYVSNEKPHHVSWRNTYEKVIGIL